MEWQFFEAQRSFEHYRQQWDEYNSRSGNHALLDSKFWGSLVRHFAGRRVRLALGKDATGGAAALIETDRNGFWRTFQPAQAPVGPFLLGAAVHETSNVIRDLIHALPRYALGLSVTQQDPNIPHFQYLNDSLVWETLDYIKTPSLTVAGSFEQYWKNRSKNLIHNLSRQRRRLKEQGVTIELVTDRDTAGLDYGLREYARLERTGWKGKEGTAVTEENAQGRFYKEMLYEFSRSGEALIYRLLFNGKTVASDVCLERSGTLFILKTAYDESLQGVSLGLLLHQEIFSVVFDRSTIKTVEFYGPVKEWHVKWTNEMRRMYHINFYRHPFVAKARQWFKNFFYA